MCIRDSYLIGKLSNDAFSLELKNFMEEFASLSPHIFLDYQDMEESPMMYIANDHQQDLGIHYHLVPGGHEFNSFVLAVYNAASVGQPLDEKIVAAIQNLKSHHIQVFVSLSCTMCPEVVQATQRMALLNNQIQTSIYDLSHYPEYKEQYRIMSVPCMVIDGQQVHFGKKNIEDIIKLL